MKIDRFYSPNFTFKDYIGVQVDIKIENDINKDINKVKKIENNRMQAYGFWLLSKILNQLKMFDDSGVWGGNSKILIFVHRYIYLFGAFSLEFVSVKT